MFHFNEMYNVIHFQHAAFKWTPDIALSRDCTVMFDFLKLLLYEIILAFIKPIHTIQEILIVFC